MSAIGIDFGSSKCVVAVCMRGEIKILTNEVSNRSTPSLVAYSRNKAERAIGEAAQSQINRNLANTVSDIKLLIGRKFSDPVVQECLSTFPYKLVEGENDSIRIKVRYNKEELLLTTQEVAGALFGQLRRMAAESIGSDVKDAVISVPSFFTEVQRRALIDAARVGGLSVLSLMNDNTAVGLQFGLLRSLPPQESPINVMFFNMGARYLQVTLTSIAEGKMQVLAHAASPKIGGVVFDQIIADLMVKQVKAKFNLDASESPRALMRIQMEAIKIKKVLSANTECPWGLECFIDDVDVSGIINREDILALAAPYLEQLLAPVKKVLADASVAIEDVESLEIVGGAVRVPVIQSMLESFFGRPLHKTCDGSESVARGCALQAAMLSPAYKVKEFKIHEIISYPIESRFGPIGGPMGEASPVFGQGNAMPSSKIVGYPLNTPFEVQFNYADPSSIPVKSDSVLGGYVFTDLPSLPDKAKVKIAMKIDISGLLNVTSGSVMVDAKDQPMEVDPKVEASTEADATPATETEDKPKKKKRVKQELVFDGRIVGTLSNDDFNTSFEREASMANSDRVIAETLRCKNDLESLIYEVRDKLSLEFAEFATDAEKSTLTELSNENEMWLYEDGEFAQKSVYEVRIKKIRDLLTPIARRVWERASYPAAAANLKKLVFANVQNVRDESNLYDHIDPVDMKKLEAKCQGIDRWITEMDVKQGALPMNTDVIFTVQEITSKADELTKLAKQILSKPKPKVEEPVVETPTPEGAPAEDAMDVDQKPADAMEVDAATEDAVDATD